MFILEFLEYKWKDNKLEELEKLEYQNTLLEIKKAKLIINQYLQGNNAFELCKFLDKQRIMELAAKDSDLFIMEIMKQAQKQEQLLGMLGVFTNRSLQEIVEVYEQLELLLRRIEFDLPQEYQEELFIYIKQQRLSWVSVFEVIKDAPYILDKRKVTEKVQNMLL